MKKFSRILNSIKELSLVCMPHTITEKLILAIGLAWFLSFSMYFALKVDFSCQNELMGYDSFFYIGGDNPKLMLHKIISWNLRHPIFVIINLPLLIIDALLPYNLHVALFGVVSSTMMAFSNLFIYKICNCLKIEEKSSIVSIILFSTFISDFSR